MIRAVLGLIAAVALTGCGNSVRDKETAARAMDQFHERFNAGDYGKIYDTASPEFQSKNVRADFLQLLSEVHRQLGSYRTCDSQGWETSLFGEDTRVKLRYKTAFVAGDADEEFVYGVSGSRATLRAYRVDSAALNTR